MKLVNKFNKKDIKENDILLFETKDFGAIDDMKKFFQDLQKEIPENVSIVCLKKGDFLSLKTEKHMNNLGWYRIDKGDKTQFPNVLNKVSLT